MQICCCPSCRMVFSGRIASNTIKLLSSDSDIIIIAGGHLSELDSVLTAEENKFETPLGYINNSEVLLEKLIDLKIVKPDRVPDIQLRYSFLCKILFPKSEVIWLRMPPDYNKVKNITIVK